MAIRPRRLRGYKLATPGGGMRGHTLLTLLGVLLFGVAIIGSSVLHLRGLSRGAGGLAITLIAIGGMIRTWTDGRAGVIHDRFTQIRRADVPHTFVASVAFKLLVCLIMALAGMWIFLTAGSTR